MKIGILGAMQEEVEGIIENMEQTRVSECGNRLFYEGFFCGKEIVVAFSRWGKIEAATAATTMILLFKVERILFTGVAGATSEELRLGDIIVGEHFFQHDMDARPFFKKFEIPLLGFTSISANEAEVKFAETAVHNFLKNCKNFRQELLKFGIATPRLFLGDVASGDKFVSGAENKLAINKSLPSVLCVEMEGAAVAQVCFNFGVPFAVIRTISDIVNSEESDAKVSRFFTQNLAAQYGFLIAKEYVALF